METRTESAAGLLDPRDCAGLTLLGDLPHDLLARVLASARLADVAAGEIILRRGEHNETLHFLLSGLLHVHLDLVETSRAAELQPGSMFGEVSVIDGQPASAFVLAAAPSRVLLVPGALFWAEIANAPGVARSVMRALIRILRTNTAAAAAALQERLRHEALSRELAFAREIQMGMLQHPTPWFPGEERFAVAAFIEPATQVGGDLYDAFLLDGDHLLVAIGDVSGKGVAAALVMVRTLALLRGAAAGRKPPRQVMAEMNEALAANNDASMFVTMFVGVLDLRSGTLDCLNFGHCPPLLRRADGTVAFHAVPPAPALGVFEGALPGEARVVLEPGETLLLYSDGVTEAMDPDGAPFGNDRLLAAAAALPSGEPEPLVRHVATEVLGFGGDAGQADDVTLLALGRRGPPRAG
jgi:sigma-B regulation protein RsbU (phosphoserine phosphatase)